MLPISSTSALGDTGLLPRSSPEAPQSKIILASLRPVGQSPGDLVQPGKTVPLIGGQSQGQRQKSTASTYRCNGGPVVAQPGPHPHALPGLRPTRTPGEPPAPDLRERPPDYPRGSSPRGAGRDYGARPIPTRVGGDPALVALLRAVAPLKHGRHGEEDVRPP